MKKKTIIILVSFFVLFITSLVANYYDSARVRAGQEPKLTIKVVNNEGKKITYWGLGYKIIRYPSISPDEPYENNLGVKFGNWFMTYKQPEQQTENEELPITDNKDLWAETEEVITEENNSPNEEVVEEDKKTSLDNTTPIIKEENIEDYNTTKEDTTLIIKNITDKTLAMKDFACAQAIDVFYEDASYKYYYTCIKSQYIIVEYTNNTEETVKEALKHKHITITDLDNYNIKYLKEAKNVYIK